ncbi:MAG: Gldg family protein [Candidatus Ventricola sp.]|nr:Gldg family protein [Candidatus Ventricola sp.]
MKTKHERPAREKRPLKERVRRMFGRRFRAGGYAVFAAAVVIAIAVLANLLVCALPSEKTKIDLTDQSLYTLGDQTRRILSSLDQDVTLYLLATSGYEDETISRLLDRYADQSSHVRVQYIDPTQKPTFLDGYDLDLTRLYANSVLVECGSRVRLVGYDEIYVTSYSMDYSSYSYTSSTSFDGENALTNAIHYVSSDAIPKVYTLTGHGETALGDTIVGYIERDNLETESLSLLSLDAVPEDASAIVINVPTGDLSSDEADMLIAFLESGGRIVLITDYIGQGEMENLLRVTAAMGLTAGRGLAVEGDANRHLSRYPYYLLPEIGEHEITEPLISGGYYVLAPLAQPLEQVEGTGASITWLLTTSDSSYSKVAGLEMTTTAREEGDIDGPLNIAAASELGEGRMVWLTSAEMLVSSIDAMVSGANSDLFMNSLDWMCEQEETISIRSKSLDTTGLTLTSAQSGFWSAVLIGVIPAALVIAGIVIVIRRKRR